MSMVRTRHSTFKYLTVAAADHYWGLHVTGSGRADIPPEAPYPPPVHPEGYSFDWPHGRVLAGFQVLYITRGSGFFESKATGRLRVEEGSVILLFPDVWHRYMPDAEVGWTEHWIAFDGSAPRMLQKQRIFSPEHPVMDVGVQETLLRLYGEVLDRIEMEKIGFKEVAAALTMQILAHIHAIRRRRQFGGKEVADVVHRAKLYFVEHLHEPINLEGVAGILGVGYSWFRHRFRDYTGLSPAQYLIQLRINKAKELLSGTSFSMQEVTGASGFQSPYYFSRLFRQKVGVTPSQWRRYSRGESLRSPAGSFELREVVAVTNHDDREDEQ